MHINRSYGHKTRSRFRCRLGALSLGLLTATAALTALQPQPASADEFYYSYGAWNGKKVYLSPARHSDAGGRGECGGNNENAMAFTTARAATNGDHYGDYTQDYSSPTGAGRNLRARGYQVRIGTGTINTAITNSNAWGTHIHIPIHSNARTESCTNTVLSPHGTVVISASAAGASLSTQMRYAHEASSPGTGDQTCTDTSGCTSITLAELRQTTAVASYLEADFHSWNTGVNWVRSGHRWGWRISWGVDRYLGYPR